MNRSTLPRATRLVVGMGFALGLCAQAMAQPQATPEPTGREAAPVDMTGYWVSVITEDWRWRMMTPAKGDYASLPLNDEGRRVADTWDPDNDADNCKPYGAAGLMRMPLRVHVHWEDDDTLRIDTDHGMQSRMLHFNDSDSMGGEPTLQGDSVAEWDGASLNVVTSHLSAGYLRRNGVPYSENTVLTEYFERHAAYDEEWITVTTIVNDPQYLRQEFITSSSFKRLQDDSSWNPVACESR